MDFFEHFRVLENLITPRLNSSSPLWNTEIFYLSCCAAETTLVIKENSRLPSASTSARLVE
jgi:hypothetical protein